MFTLLFIIVAALFPGPVAADEHSIKREPAQLRVYELEELLRGTDITPALSGLQVSLLENFDATQTFAAGVAQVLGEASTPLRADHKVRIASISKLVVAIGVMRLVEKGALDLDEDVSKYLGWSLRNPRFPDQKITARHLLSHTSSVRDGSRYFIAAGTGQLRDFFDPATDFWDGGQHFSAQEIEVPGRYFVYSNLNFGLLGEIIERLSGQRFDQYMQQEVLAPMGLSASFDSCTVPVDQRAAAFRKRSDDGLLWDPRGPWVPQVDAGEPRCFYGMRSDAQAASFLSSYQLGSNASLYSPQGGLRASADELVQVLRMLANDGVVNSQRILEAKSVNALLEPQWTLNPKRDNGLSAGEAEPGGPTDGLMTSYGLSVHRIDMRAWGFDTGPALLVGHLGEAYGVLSHALYDPATGDGIATIITGTADDPAKSDPGHSPLYRVEEEVLRWWLNQRAGHR
ncbi:MAG: serine hydrolase domain-containing protein [Pseudomonadota bacterium]